MTLTKIPAWEMELEKALQTQAKIAFGEQFRPRTVEGILGQVRNIRKDAQAEAINEIENAYRTKEGKLKFAEAEKATNEISKKIEELKEGSC